MHSEIPFRQKKAGTHIQQSLSVCPIVMFLYASSPPPPPPTPQPREKHTNLPFEGFPFRFT